MRLREYRPEDVSTLAQLYYNTVHTINAKDYSKSQLDVWATGKVDLLAWNSTFLEHNTIVAEEDGIIVGFGDMDESGYLDRLFVHKDYQGLGIAKAIVERLEKDAYQHKITSFCTHASITAKPFFEKLGYHELYENTVVREGIKLINYVMRKEE
jgi:putative acetyltransferase